MQIENNNNLDIRNCSPTADSSSEIAKFYEESSVFVTGGTGFVGKALIEKLLRSCPGVKSIFLLIRPKRGKDIDSRYQELLENPVNTIFKISCVLLRIIDVITYHSYSILVLND